MRKVSKDKVLTSIKECQPLEIAMVEVDRNENASMKRQKIAAYLRLVDEYLKSERSLILLAVQEK